MNVGTVINCLRIWGQECSPLIVEDPISVWWTWKEMKVTYYSTDLLTYCQKVTHGNKVTALDWTQQRCPVSAGLTGTSSEFHWTRNCPVNCL